LPDSPTALYALAPTEILWSAVVIGSLSGRF
jgi:hypothetical protein